MENKFLNANGVVHLWNKIIDKFASKEEVAALASSVIEGYYYANKFYSDSDRTDILSGEEGKIYIDISSGTLFRFNGSTYIQLTATGSSSGGNANITGNGILETVLNDNYTLTIKFTDGTSYTTTSIRGSQGEQGAQGERGKSIYDIAVDNGFEGDEADFIASLKGDVGSSGVYVGSGEMPENCNVQIDTDGEIIKIPTKTSQLENDSGFITEEETEKNVKYVDDITFGVDDIAITDNIATLGTGWSGNVEDGFTHANGSVEPLSFAINANDSEKFIIEYNTSVTGDYILLKLGNAESIESVYPTSPYNGTTSIQWGLVCSGDNGILQIIPTSNFTGTITNIKVYKITENGEKEITVDLDNVGIGNLPKHIAGFYNFYLSPTSMQKSVNGTRNVAIGYASLRDIVSGGRNIGLGTFTLASLIYGENNIGIGADAGLNLQLAENIVAIGKGAAAFGAKRTDDIAIGRYSLSGSKGTENTSKNVAIGVEAGRDCQSSGNVFIGTSAGAKVSNSNNNVIIGNGAGNKITTGWGNTIIGAGANANASNTRTTVIGQGAAATKNYQAVLGGDTTIETVLKGDIVVRGTDGIYRKIAFNTDGTCSWAETTI